VIDYTRYEEVYLHSYERPKEARQGLARYRAFSNHERPHQALRYRTPPQVYGANTARTQTSGATMSQARVLSL
jgi:transposase InsO family protein